LSWEFIIIQRAEKHIHFLGCADMNALRRECLKAFMSEQQKTLKILLGAPKHQNKFLAHAPVCRRTFGKRKINCQLLEVRGKVRWMQG